MLLTTSRRTLLAVALALATAAAAAPAPRAPQDAVDDDPEVPLRSANDLPPVPIGASVGAFSFVDSRYLPRTLDELGEHAAFVVAIRLLSGSTVMNDPVW